VGRIGKDKEMIGITVPKRLAAIIDDRREMLRWPRAAFALAILEEWAARGCPPVNESDRLMQVARQATAKSPRKIA
jgi:hypothetical protein